MANQAPSGGQEIRLRREARMLFRGAREHLKLSQGEFAKALGDHLGHPISQSQVSDWERGRFEPGASVLLAAAELANLSIDELRGAGPSALIERLDRLEERLESLPAGQNAGGLAAVERELERIGELQAQMIKALTHAGLWPVAGTDADRVERGTRSRRAGSKE